jgi:hypothetical protein
MGLIYISLNITRRSRISCMQLIIQTGIQATTNITLSQQII